MIKDKNVLRQFYKWNKILGWTVFTIAVVTYTLTVAPTNSFWDVGEYIATASKLQVGHPPGAPLFQMMGAFISIFALHNDQIAFTVNMISVISSAFTIAFLFWSITLLAKKTVKNPGQVSKKQQIAILGSSLTGSLAFAFTDSFWFNAVEAEVYAMATMMLSLTFYLGLLWERDLHTKRGNRWGILIALIIGLAFGVHFMAILAIPAIVLLCYFQYTKKSSILNSIIANSTAILVLLFIFIILIPYTLKFFAAAELFCVNILRFPFNSGISIALLSLLILCYIGLSYTRKRRLQRLNTALLGIVFILIGFSSWVMLPIRATAGTVINEDNPSTIHELLAYYNLEQYPSIPLLYGPQFTETYSYLDPKNPYEDDQPKYKKDHHTRKYVVVNDWKDAKQNLDDGHKSLFPRMWSTEHSTNYMRFTAPISFKIKAKYSDQKEVLSAVATFRKNDALGKIDHNGYHKFLQDFGNYLDVEKPSFVDNLNYLFRYQIGYMYWRYFMWNFVGRQNDIQGELDNLNGNWLSGIPVVDEWHLGSQNNLPDSVVHHKARNTYYFLPLLLGIIGFLFHFRSDKQRFWAVFVFFLFTGIALKVYLNEKPFEVRERDYALVGSFYVFAIWIGLGVLGLYTLLQNKLNIKFLPVFITVICVCAVPGVLVAKNWDDHDRSHQYTASTLPKNYLSSCQENAILFTIGDNDTFSLWYAQDIEGYRTDIRTIVAGYLATDWYVDQMKKKAYHSDPLSISLTHEFYAYGNNDVIYYQSVTEDTMLIKDWLRWITSNDPRTKGHLQSGAIVNSFPSKNIRIPVDKDAVLRNGIVAQKDADKIVPYIDIQLSGDYLLKHRLVMLDIVANTNWKRPIYFSGGSFGDDDYIWMKDYLQLDGLTYKLVPIKTKVDPKNPYEYGRIDTERMYQTVMNWKWDHSNNSNVYHDPVTRRNAISYRISLGRLAEQLINEGEIQKAKNILDLGIEKLPVDLYEYYTTLRRFIEGYFRINENEKALQLWEQIANKYQQQLMYYGNLPLKEQLQYIEEIITTIEYYKDLVELLSKNSQKEIAEIKTTEFEKFLQLFKRLYYE
ncbi:DUF2723 domain-containing protein [Aquimarina sp. U1-2]|uniref:glycosyltransferase family 117 protein n=1 Tax=Aquimarina sp. U1-2 TaxID=2823141 RepID=UPI001AED0BB3|nr:DUF2723 domain-containing protein [Aquimarina sp. U1-2]